MSSVKYISFSGGELAPSLWARTDLVKYATGLRACRNFIVMRHGGVANRPGTSFVAEVKDSTKAIRLIPFIFNASQTYVLEFGDQYMRVHRNGAQVTETAKNITGATKANPCVITIATHGFLDGEEVYAASVVGMTQLNNRNFKIANKTTNTFEIQDMGGTNIDATGYDAYTSGGTAARVYTITTPFVEADLPTLQYIQSADVVTLTHPNYAPRELARTGHAAWTLSAITFGAAIAAPTGLASSSAGTTYYYKVTAVDAESGEESLPSAAAGSTTLTSTLTWGVVTGAGYYNVYRLVNGQYGWIGIAGSTSFVDATYTPDPLDSPPVARTPFTGAGNYPSTVAYYQQRLIFANTDNDPEGVYTSKTGLYKNFMKSTPLQDDDAVTFALVGRQVNEVQHLLDIGKLLVFTTSGEWAIDGDPSGILTPGQVNPTQRTANGSGSLAPLVVDGSALYVQARGSIIRDINYEWQSQDYKGNELTIFASHLFDNYTLVDWAYQQVPHSIVWAVRSDGILLGMTYVREHQVNGWHRHDFKGVDPSIGENYLADGEYAADASIFASGGADDYVEGLCENVCVVSEGSEDVLYLLIKRSINGRTVRYIERMNTRQVVDIEDMVLMDCSLSYDGRNTNTSHTMQLTGGVTWEYDEDLTLESSAAYFASTDVGNEIVLEDEDEDEILRCRITGYTSTTVVTVRPHKTVPAVLRSVVTYSWSKAVDEVGGLWHLEGRAVSILVDGFVSASPNNPSYTTRTVADGKVSIADPHAVIHVGIPYISDMETLNIDTTGSSSMADKKKNISKLTVFVESSRGIWAGPDEDNLTEFKPTGVNYDGPPALQTGTIDMNIRSEWNSTGKVLIRQVDPLPVSILAIVPAGYIAQ